MRQTIRGRWWHRTDAVKAKDAKTGLGALFDKKRMRTMSVLSESQPEVMATASGKSSH